jgi:hypothetical protein
MWGIHLVLWPPFGLLHQPQMIWSSQWNDNWQGNRSTRRNPAPEPLCSPQIPPDLGLNPGHHDENTSALYGGEWSASRPGAHWTAGWVGPGAVWTLWGNKILHCQETNAGIQPIARRCTDLSYPNFSRNRNATATEKLPSCHL